MSFLLTVFLTPNTRCLFQYHFYSPAPTRCHTNSFLTLTVGFSVRLHSLRVPFHKTAFQVPGPSHCYLAEDHRSLDNLTELRKELCFPSFNHCTTKGYNSGTAKWKRCVGDGHRASTPSPGTLCDSALAMCMEC